MEVAAGTHSPLPTSPLIWHEETGPVVPSANPSGARPVPLDPLDHILVLGRCGWSAPLCNSS